MVICTWFAVSFGLSLWLASTALAKWMNPIYIEAENQKKILSLASEVEDLEQKIVSQTKFITTLQNIIRGKSHTSDAALSPMPPAISKPTAEMPIEEKSIEESPVVETATAEAAETAVIKTESYMSPSTMHTMAASVQNMQNMAGLFFPPIHGSITDTFNKTSGHYGVDIVAKEKDPVKAIASGMVILTDWSVDTGWIIVIQHHNNLVSICKHCAFLFKKVGNLVKAGDVVALMGKSGELLSGPHLHFELWSEGVALNPEDFIKISRKNVQ
ncbi:M23 family metallopeptidase [Candidatus Cardinium hertigii]|jgi:murein DD-endopeptidase MepM/ murein hydrolase activator NlpD|nr:M23 family metallopeptidase [Candidatus Cardinium hertigii]